MTSIDVSCDGATCSVHLGSGHAFSVIIDEVPPAGEGVPFEALVAAAFEFLLDREPVDAILPSFRLSVIGRYFADYPAGLAEYLER